VKGYLDKISTKEVTKFENDFLQKLRNSYPEILNSIKKEQKITDETETKLKKIIEEFVSTFLNHAPSSHFDHVGLNDKLKKCVQCHSFTETNPTSLAPSLHNIFNRKNSCDTKEIFDEVYRDFDYNFYKKTYI
jgi:hypothetical protein